MRVPEARRIEGETVEKHIAGYRNAAVLTSEQNDVVQKLTQNLLGEISEASATVMQTLQNALIGRTQSDIFRRVGLETVAMQEATGRGAYRVLPEFVETLRREGITAFVDKAGRRWSLHTYGAMVCRTTSRQAEVLSVLTADRSKTCTRSAATAALAPSVRRWRGGCTPRAGLIQTFHRWRQPLAKWIRQGRIICQTAI